MFLFSFCHFEQTGHVQLQQLCLKRAANTMFQDLKIKTYNIFRRLTYRTQWWVTLFWTNKHNKSKILQSALLPKLWKPKGNKWKMDKTFRLFSEKKQNLWHFFMEATDSERKMKISLSSPKLHLDVQNPRIWQFPTKKKTTLGPNLLKNLFRARL